MYRSTTWISAALVLLLAVALTLHRIIAADLWLHLAAGRWIVDNLRVPGAELFSFTAAGHTWVDLHWAYQLVTYAAYRLAGGVGIQLLHAAAILAALLIMGTRIARAGGTAIGWLFVALALLAGSERFLCRPEAFTLLFVSIAWWQSERILRGVCPSYTWLGFQIVWANFQGLFILGPIIFALRAVGAVLDARSDRVKVAPLAVRRLLVMGLLMLVVSIVNPYGLKGLLLPFRLLSQLTGESVYAPVLGELQSPFEGRVTPVLFLCSAAVALLAWCLDRHRRLSDFLPMLAFGLLAFSGRRNILLFELVAMVPIALALSRIAAAVRRGERRPLEAGMALAVPIALLGALLWVAGGRFYYELRSIKTTGFGFSETEYPVEATRYLAANADGGNVYNSLSDGDYLIWHLGPDWKVLFDGRAEVYGEKLGRKLMTSYADTTAFRLLTDRYDIRFILMDMTQPFGRRFVWRRVFEHGDELLFLDQRAAVVGMGENLPEGIDLAAMAQAASGKERWMIPDARRLRPWDWRVEFPLVTARSARTYSEINLHAVAAAEQELAVQQFPCSADLFNDYGVSLLRSGYVRQAVDAFDQALVLDPDMTRSAIGRSWAVAALGGPARAFEWLEPWCERHAAALPAWVALAEHAAAAGHRKRTVELAEIIHRHNSSLVKELASLLLQVGERDRAREMIEPYLRLHPDDPAALTIYHRSGGPRK